MSAKTASATLAGDSFAELNERVYGARTHDDSRLAVLTALAGDGPVLALGVGTGRLAIPLAAAGVEVHGIDNSAKMLGQLAATPGGERVFTHEVDCRQFTLNRMFSLVFIPFNRLTHLTSQEEQLACVQMAARHLHDHGHFVVEASVPDRQTFSRAGALRGIDTDEARLVFEAIWQDPVSQRLRLQLIEFENGEERRLAHLDGRYVWPSELDLMGRLAGLRLTHRWSDWLKAPFNGRSTEHISVYDNPGRCPLPPA